jgi:phosphinothricin acetyltransferase
MTPSIRLAGRGDGDAMASIYRPAVEGITSFETTPPTAAEMDARAARVLARLPWIVCEVDGVVAGYAYASRHRERDAYRWTAEVSAYVGDGFHRRGIGRALYSSLFALLGAQGIATLVAGIALPNEASVEFHESMGFTPLGVFHRVGFKQARAVDVAWLERHLSTAAVPSEPIPLPDLPAGVLRAGLAAGLAAVRG